MRVWVSSPSIEWNGYVYLREHMEIPHRVTLTWMAFTKIDHFILQILFTSAFKMAELYRFIQICPHVTSKKNHSFLTASIFSRSIKNQPILLNIFFALRTFRKMQYRPYCFCLLCYRWSPIIRKYTKAWHIEYKVYNKFLLYLYQDG